MIGGTIGGKQMKRYNSRIAIFKGISNGLICALFINILVIMSLYINFPSYLYYLMGLPLAITTYVFLRQKEMAFFFVSWGISILTFIMVVTLISMTNVIHIWYSHIYLEIGKMSAGEGFAIMTIYLYNLIWVVLGTVGAFIQTIFNK